MVKKPWLITVTTLSIVSAAAIAIPLVTQTERFANEDLVFIKLLQSPYPFYLPFKKGVTAREALNRIGVVEIASILKHVGRQKIVWDWNAPVEATTTFTVKQK